MECQKGKPTCVLCTVGPLYPQVLYPWIQPTMMSNFHPQLVESTDAEPVDTEGWLYYTILYKRPERPLMLVHVGVLEPISHRSQGTTVFSQRSLTPKGKRDPINFKATMQWMKEEKPWKGMTELRKVLCWGRTESIDQFHLDYNAYFGKGHKRIAHILSYCGGNYFKRRAEMLKSTYLQLCIMPFSRSLISSAWNHLQLDHLKENLILKTNKQT